MPRPRLTVKNSVGSTIRVLSEGFRTESRKATLRMAEHLAGRVREIILAQSEPWPPLNSDYLEQKLAEGLDGRMLIATSRYVNSIRARLDPESNGYLVMPREEPISEGSEDTLVDLGVWHEFGTRNDDGSVKMPARPHFRPAWSEFKRDLSNNKKRFGAQVFRSFKRKRDWKGRTVTRRHGL